LKQNITGDIKIISLKDCGNSPKKLLLKQLTIAFATHQIETLFDLFTDDFLWNIVGDRKIQSKEIFIEELKRRRSMEVSELHIINIITHGASGAINGTMTLKDQTKLTFCDVYIFNGAGKSAKIKELTSYHIYE